MLKQIALSALLVVVAHRVLAQETWLGSKKFRYTVGEEVSVDFLSGDNFVGEPWDVLKNKAAIVQWFSLSEVKGGAIVPAHDALVTHTPGKDGTQLVIMQSNAAERAWQGTEFTSYLETNGIENVTGLRKKANVTDLPVKEIITHYAKLLVQAGAVTDNTFNRKTGLRIEIIPDKNPYALKTGDYLQCLILVEGKPSPHTLVKVWSRLNRTTFLQNIYTEDDGTIKFPISTKGAWMVSTMKMVPDEKARENWQSMAGSLVFGIE